MVPEALKPVTKVAGKVALEMQKHAPEILTGAGIIGMGASVYSGCKASTKLEETMNRYEIHQNKSRLAKDIVKLYGPCVTLFGVSAAAILAAHGILSGRVAGTAAALKAAEEGFNLYRKRVIEDQGEDKDILYRHGIQKVTNLVKDENGVEKPVSHYEKADIRKAGEPSIYARIFDEYNPNWSKDPRENLIFLKAQQSYANDKLHAYGYLRFGEVLRNLGFKETSDSMVTGWVVKPGNHNYVDFGIYDIYNDRKNLFINGDEPSIMLDFNVDGCILADIPD